MKKYFKYVVIMCAIFLFACNGNGKENTSDDIKKGNVIHFLVDNEENLALQQVLFDDDELISQIDTSDVINSKDGYIFKGFYYQEEMIYNESGSKIYDLNITEDINLVANFEIIDYNITFELNGGILENMINSYTILDEVDLEQFIPQKEGYLFLGWFTSDDTDEENKTSNIQVGSTGDKTFYAQWDKAYKITYMFMDNVLEKWMYLKDSGIIELLSYDLYGYEFDGWYFDRNFMHKAEYIESDECKDIVLFGKFNPKSCIINTEYEVKFNSNGGTYVPSQTISAGSSIIEPENPSKDGYIFTGWYRDKECKKYYELYEYIFTDLTLYAGWKEKSEDYDNLSYSNLIYPNHYKDANTILTMSEKGESFYYVTETGFHTIYYRTNYFTTSAFLSISNETQGNLYLIKTIVFTHFQSIDIYARKGDIISINVNNSRYSDFEFYFDGFHSTASNISLGISRNITFNENYKLDYTEIKGYEFKGYFTSPNGKGIRLTNEQGESLEPLNSLSISSIYPYYKPIEYFINYEFDENYLAEGETIITKYTYDDGCLKLPIIERTGYTFYGWCESEDLIDEVLIIDCERCCDLTLYAKLLPNKYLLNIETDLEGQIKFDSQGGTKVESQNFDCENTQVIIPDEPSKSGYVFKGWYFDKECTQYCDFSSDFSCDLTLYAGWEPISEKYKGIFRNIDTSKYIEESYKDDSLTSGNYYYFFNVKESGIFSFEFSVYAEKSRVKVTNMTQEIMYYNELSCSDLVCVSAQKGDVIILQCYPINSDRTYESTITIDFTKYYNHRLSSVNFDKSKQYIIYDSDYVLEYEEIPGLRFLGYFTKKNGEGLQLTDKLGKSISKWTSLESMQAYAYYEEATYTITYNCDNGNFVEETYPIEFKYDSETINLPILIKTGYEFDGWYLSEDFSGEKIENIETGTHKDLILYAKFIPNKYIIHVNNDFTYIVSFVTNSESIIEDQYITSTNPKINIPSDPVKEGYGFRGWYDDIECTKYHDFDSPITGNLVLYADWEEFKYKTISSSTNVNPKNHTNESKALYQEIGLENTGSNYIHLYFKAEKTGTFKFYYKNGISPDKKYSVNWTLYNETQKTTCVMGSFSNYSYFNVKIINVNEGDVLSLYLSQYRGYETAAQFYFGEYQTISNLGEYSASKYIVEYEKKYTIPYIEKDSLKFMGYYTEINGQGLRITDEFGNSLIGWNKLENITVYAYYINE